jgi:uncharacterized protein with FMN-binding domain
VRARAALGGIFASVAVLGIGWQLGSAAVTASTSTASTGTASSGAASAGAATGSTAAASSSAALKDGTFTGSSESTRFGDVQVEVVVSGGKITEVKALQLTDDGGRSVQISNSAAPILRSEVLASQSARVAGVSGATYTTEGYLSSVQSAIDQAAR